AGQAAINLVEGEFREQGDAVKTLLAVGFDVVAARFELGAGEVLIEAFDFLEADDVGPGLVEPGEDRVQARVDTVDVPGRDAHDVSPSGRRLHLSTSTQEMT